MMCLLKRIAWIWACLTIKTRGWGLVGNRVIYKGINKQNTKEVTITVRKLNEPDSYSREELLNLLKLIRVHEEKMQWQVPEPLRCGYCGHCSPVNEDGFCPVIMHPKPHQDAKLSSKSFPCGCPLHKSGLEDAITKDVNKRLRRGEWKEPVKTVEV